MRVLLFSGSHSRHTYVHNALLERFDVCGVVSMQREPEIPKAPDGIPAIDRKLFDAHFATRAEIESAAFGYRPPRLAYAEVRTRFVEANELNSNETATFVEQSKADIAVIFGVDLIKDPVLSGLPKNRINLHLGLSPWYKGSATLFWPFYFLEPQFAGATIHQIVPAADAGAIIHQTVPELRRGDGIHDVGSRTVLEATRDLVALLEEFSVQGKFQETLQTKSGRLFLTGDFHPAHLRVIYQQFDNKIVDAFLDGLLGKKKPNLIVGSTRQ